MLRQQNISPQAFAVFGLVFGQPEKHHVFAMRQPQVETLTMLSNQNETGRNPIMKWFGNSRDVSAGSSQNGGCHKNRS